MFRKCILDDLRVSDRLKATGLDYVLLDGERVHHILWQLGGLAGAGVARDDEEAIVDEAVLDLLLVLENGQSFPECLHLVLLLHCSLL